MKITVAVSMNFCGEVEVDAATPEAAIEKMIALKERALPMETPVTIDYFVYGDDGIEVNTTIHHDGRRIDWDSRKAVGP